jgi:hypothetical protein
MRIQLFERVHPDIKYVRTIPHLIYATIRLATDERLHSSNILDQFITKQWYYVLRYALLEQWKGIRV